MSQLWLLFTQTLQHHLWKHFDDKILIIASCQFKFFVPSDRHGVDETLNINPDVLFEPRYFSNYFLFPVQIDGKWSEWSAFSECKKVDKCWNTVRERTRNCSEAFYGGKPCEGPERNRTSCTMVNCPPGEFLSLFSFWPPLFLNIRRWTNAGILWENGREIV